MAAASSAMVWPRVPPSRARRSPGQRRARERCRGPGPGAGCSGGRRGAGGCRCAGAGGRGRLEIAQQVRVATERQPAVGAEAVLAAVDRRAARAGGDTGFAQDRDGLALGQRRLQRAQLGVDVPERVELGDHQSVVALAEAVQVEDEAAEVAIGELTCLAQEARAPAHASARSEARRRRGCGAVDRPAVLGRLGGRLRGAAARGRLRESWQIADPRPTHATPSAPGQRAMPPPRVRPSTLPSSASRLPAPAPVDRRRRSAAPGRRPSG